MRKWERYSLRMYEEFRVSVKGDWIHGQWLHNASEAIIIFQYFTIGTGRNYHGDLSRTVVHSDRRPNSHPRDRSTAVGRSAPYGSS